MTLGKSDVRIVFGYCYLNLMMYQTGSGERFAIALI